MNQLTMHFVNHRYCFIFKTGLCFVEWYFEYIIFVVHEHESIKATDELAVTVSQCTRRVWTQQIWLLSILTVTVQWRVPVAVAISSVRRKFSNASFRLNSCENHLDFNVLQSNRCWCSEGLQVHRNYQQSLLQSSRRTDKKRTFSQLGKLHEHQETSKLISELKRLKTGHCYVQTLPRN